MMTELNCMFYTRILNIFAIEAKSVLYMVLLAAHFQPTQFAKTESGIPIFENKILKGHWILWRNFLVLEETENNNNNKCESKNNTTSFVGSFGNNEKVEK